MCTRRLLIYLFSIMTDGSNTVRDDVSIIIHDREYHRIDVTHEDLIEVAVDEIHRLANFQLGVQASFVLIKGNVLLDRVLLGPLPFWGT